MLTLSKLAVSLLVAATLLLLPGHPRHGFGCGTRLVNGAALHDDAAPHCASDRPLEEEACRVAATGGCFELSEHRSVQAVQGITAVLEAERALAKVHEKRAVLLEKARAKIVADQRANVPEGELERVRAAIDLEAPLPDHPWSTCGAGLAEEPTDEQVVLPGASASPQFFENFFMLRHDSVAQEQGLVGVMTIPLRSAYAKGAGRKGGYGEVAVSVWWNLLPTGDLVLHDLFLQAKLAPIRGLVSSKHREQSASGLSVHPVALGLHNPFGPWLITVLSDGRVLRHNLTAMFFGLRIAGKKEGLEDATSQNPAQDGKPAILLAADEKDVKSLCRGDDEGEAEGGQVDSCGANRVEFAEFLQFRKTTALLSYIGGVLRIHRQDVTLWSFSESILDQAPVAAATNGNQIAVSSGKSVLILNPGSLDVGAKRVCSAPPATKIVSLAFDVLLPTVLYGGTDQGEVVIFHTRSREMSKSGGGRNTGCKISSKLAVDAAIFFGSGLQRSSQRGQVARPVAVRALTGYVVASVDGALVVYNSTGSARNAPRYLFAQALDTRDGQATSAMPRLEAVRYGPTSKSTQYWLLSGPSSATTQCTVYESLLPYEEVKTEMLGWMRGPMMLGIGALVFFWQFSRSRQSARKSMGGFPGAMGGGMMPGMMSGAMPGDGRMGGGSRMDSGLEDFLRRGGMGSDGGGFTGGGRGRPSRGLRPGAAKRVGTIFS